MLQKRTSKTVQSILSVRGNTSTRSSSSNTRITTSNILRQKEEEEKQQPRNRLHQHQHQQYRRFFNGGQYPSLNHNIASSQPFLHLQHLQHLQPYQHKRQQNNHQLFHTESEYHNQADASLNTIQDTLEYYFEDNADSFLQSSMLNQSFEINFSSGVLTITLPPHGTWVLNKQTPNEQIWWSSPLSGPRRYEWDEQNAKWVWTKYVDYCKANTKGGSDDARIMTEQSWTETKSLGEAMKRELVDTFKLDDGLEDLDDL